MVTESVAIEAALVAVKAATDPDRDAWQQFDRRARTWESRYRSAALALFRKERDAVAERIMAAVPGVKAHDPPATVADPFVDWALVAIAADYAPGGAYHAAWLARYQSLITRTMQVGAGRIGLSFTLSNLRAQAAAQRRARHITGQVTETTLQRVRDVVQQARAEGVGVSEVARRIRNDAFGAEITLARAQIIARTETVGALNEAQWLRATESGVMRAKRWLSQRDGRVRDTHTSADAQGWIGLAERFESNSLLYPHEPGAPAAEVIQCRCTLLFTDQSPVEANRGSP